MSTPLLSVKDLTVSFAAGAGGLLRRSHGSLTAVDQVSFELERGECLGLIGESGSGKTTLGRAVTQLVTAEKGHILLEGVDLTALSRRELRPYRPRLQIVFQDPTESLNPRFTIEEILTEPFRLLRLGNPGEWRDRAAHLLDQVGLPQELLDRPPRYYSGGQRQRVAIARALATEPALIVLDEPTSGLDVSMQARILNLLRDLQSRLGLTYLFITHDLGAVSYLARRIAVLYRGSLVEMAPARELIAHPAHPYTVALFNALPRFVRGRDAARSSVPAPRRTPPEVSPVPGCPYAGYCLRASDRCRTERPLLRPLAPAHEVACHNPVEGGA